MSRLVFPVALAALVLLEVALVWFIMPLPGSQRIRSLDLGFLLHSWRWPLRILLLTGLAAGLPALARARPARRVLGAAAALLAGALIWFTNFRMPADRIFRQPTTLILAPAATNTVALDRLVVGVEHRGQARAYPLQFIGYHHQVRDTIGGEDVLVSYCTVCRTGRVFLPVVNGRVESFRLVGMDQFNAMFEDATTGSWWRQANGEAVTGRLEGTRLPELVSRQVTLGQWLDLYPESLVMQADPAFLDQYARDYAFERGTSRSRLTGTDTASWREKSWVVGLTLGGESRAYDWNGLRRERLIHDVLGGTPVLLVLGPDEASFFAFERPDTASRFELRGDSLVSGTAAWALNGYGTAGRLAPLPASQEFWHSWRSFQPGTSRY